MKVVVFVSSKCPHCPAAEKVVESVVPDYYEYGVCFKKIRMKTEEGKILSSRYNVMATPTILFLDEDEKEVHRIVGIPSEGVLRLKIEKIIGLRRSFLSKFFGR